MTKQKKINFKKDVFWTLDRCITISKKFKNYTTWISKEPLCYRAVYRKGWLTQCTKHMLNSPYKIFTKDECIKDAKKYSSKSAWNKKSHKIFNFSKNKGWVKECLLKANIKIRTNHWPFDICKSESVKYSTIKEWRISSPLSYHTASKNKWVKELSKHMIFPKRSWTLEECVENFKKYEGSTEWKNKSHGAYTFAKKNNWLKQCQIALNRRVKTPNHFWTYRKCKLEANKYKTISDWMRGHLSSYSSARKNNWVKKLSKHMLSISEAISLKKTKWTLEMLKAEALKHNSVSDWENNGQGCSAAQKRGLIEHCTQHMKGFIIWGTKEACLKDALRFKKRSEWNKNSAGAYVSATKNGWLEECCKHMKKFRTKEDCILAASKFKSKEEWYKKDSGSYWSAYSRGFFEECTKHMPDYAGSDRKEKRDVDKLIKLIKKHKITEIIKREEMLSNNSFPDLLLEINNKIVIIEVKHDKSRWHQSELNDQMNKYQSVAHQKYANKLEACILTSPKGKYGISFDELIKQLTKLKK